MNLLVSEVTKGYTGKCFIPSTLSFALLVSWLGDESSLMILMAVYYKLDHKSHTLFVFRYFYFCLHLNFLLLLYLSGRCFGFQTF